MSEELKSKFEEILSEHTGSSIEYLKKNIDDISPLEVYPAMQAAYDLAKADEWVSVETALPEKHKRVTIAHWIDGLTNAMVLQGSYEGNGRWRIYGGADADKITHWKPLPKAPNQ